MEIERVENKIGMSEKMRNPERIKRICNLLKEEWEKHPDQRLGQLLVNYVFGRNYKSTAHIFYQEDDITEERLKQKWIDGGNENE